MFKFLIFLFVLFFVIPYIFKLSFRLVLGNILKNTQREPQQPFRKEGEIRVEKMPRQGSRSDLGGSYIDFEEIKD